MRLAALMLLCGLALSQTTDKTLTFDVASVKPVGPPVADAQGRIFLAPPSGGPGTNDPGRIHWPYVTLKYILWNAYGVKDYQITGPSTLDSEHFEINATLPPSTTKEQFRVMLQNLLVERFHLTTHRDTRELPVYSLVVAKGGPKLQDAAPLTPPADTDSPPALPPAGPKIGADGFPVLPPSVLGRGGLFSIFMPGRYRMTARQLSMEEFVTRLSSLLKRPVIDATGLEKKYDFELTFSPDGIEGPSGMPPPPPPPGGGAAPAPSPANTVVPDGEPQPNIFTAIQAQLGLKLDPKKGPVEILVVDHVEKMPTEN